MGEKKPAIEEELADLEDLRDLFYIVMNEYIFDLFRKINCFQTPWRVQRAFALSLEKVVYVT